MHSHHESASVFNWAQLILALPFLMAWFLYLLAAFTSKKKWPLYRIVLWTFGISLSLISVIGPLAERSHTDFNAHMLSHLFLGMLAPLLLSLSAPLTLAFRSLSVQIGRKLSKLLKSKPLKIAVHPLAASILNIGGLWVLYTTGLYGLMHEHKWIYVLVHVHIFLAGYLFTIAFLYIDPVSKRYSFKFRAAVLILAFAGHGILSKFIYANPPAGVPVKQAETAGMLMYYGGDVIDILIIVVFCYQWYHASRQGTSLSQANPS
ncbi:cytochrome c oxidase assembly protein [Metabacillus sp. FJAT-52054]|uniref:Cytochrome c oxidase assembly protein n=1 Tax=Metabacillus sediminis TaxID=3117746 RepID=A0ABZ2NJC9_9BACI